MLYFQLLPSLVPKHFSGMDRKTKLTNDNVIRMCVVQIPKTRNSVVLWLVRN